MTRRAGILWSVLLLFLAACSRPTQVAQGPPSASSTLAAVTSTPEPPPTLAESPMPAPVTPLPTATATSQPTEVEVPTQGAAETSASPSPTASQAPASTPAPTQPSAQPSPAVEEQPTGCTDGAVFLSDVTIPDGTSVRQGDAFVKTWRIRNLGTCPWDSTYQLVFASGEVMDAPLSNPLPDTPPGGTIDLELEFTAPSRGGAYRSYWEFQNTGGKRFGVATGGPGWIWLEIDVSFILPTPQPGVAPTAAPSGGCAAQRDPAAESQVLALMNQARVANGLAPLAIQGQLSAAAGQHSRDMACNDFVNHSGSDGSLWYDRVSAQGYANYNSARENIYVGDPQFGGSPQGAYDWWWNSQIHRENMLFEHVNEVGIAYVFNPDSEFKGYYTVVFARP